MPTLAYLDTSALVKLYVEEDGGEQVGALVDEVGGALTASVITYAEARGVFARYLRDAKLSGEEHAALVGAFDADWQGMNEVDVTPAVYRRAGALLEAHPHLRALDALHLSSALEARAHADVLFMTFDVHLQEVALRLLPGQVRRV